MQSLSVGPDTTSPELYPQLSRIGAGLLIETLDELAAGTLVPVPQDDARATLAPVLTREDGRLLPDERTAFEAYNRWRGFTPWPGAHAVFRGKRFLVHRMHPAVSPGSQAASAGSSDAPLAPGQLDATGGELLLGTAQGSLLVLDEVQMEGKPRLAGALFARRYQLRPGERLG